MVTEGETAPDFELPGTLGDGFDAYRLTDYLDAGAVVLAFYPFDFSPVCTEALCRFNDSELLLFSDDVDVFGISLDSCYAHERFINEYEIHFPLLSDTIGRVTDAYGLAYDEWDGHEGVSKRALVTIDETQTVRYVWQTDDAYDQPSIDELQEAVKILS